VFLRTPGFEAALYSVYFVAPECTCIDFQKKDFGTKTQGSGSRCDSIEATAGLELGLRCEGPLHSHRKMYPPSTATLYLCIATGKSTHPVPDRALFKMLLHCEGPLHSHRKMYPPTVRYSTVQNTSAL
jgi:hypothetical protein